MDADLDSYVYTTEGAESRERATAEAGVPDPDADRVRLVIDGAEVMVAAKAMAAAPPTCSGSGGFAAPPGDSP